MSLATAAKFTAKSQVEKGARRFNIFELDGAQAGNDGIVRLSNGIVLRAVEVVPAKLALETSKLDWRIIHHVIEIAKAGDQCYRSFREHAKPKCSDVPEEMILDDNFIDCSALGGLKLPPLKSLLQQIGRRDPSLKKLSGQKLSNALRDFGARIPSSRPPVMVTILP